MNYIQTYYEYLLSCKLFQLQQTTAAKGRIGTKASASTSDSRK